VPQPKHRFDNAILIAIANAPLGTTNKQIQKAISDDMVKLGIPGKPPSEATISRRRSSLESEELEKWREVHWPASFGPGGLPYEAEKAVIEMLAFDALRTPRRSRPLLRAAHWFWRIRQIKPDAETTPTADVLCAAWCMAALDLNPILKQERRDEVERWLLMGGAQGHYSFFGIGNVGELAGRGWEIIARYQAPEGKSDNDTQG